MKTCNPVTCERSLQNTSRVLKNGVPNIFGSCMDCKKFLRGNRDWWANEDPLDAIEKVKIKKEDL